MTKTQPKVAIVHDILTAYGGAERVVESLLKIFPKADLYTSLYSDDSGFMVQQLEDLVKSNKKGNKKSTNARIHTSFMQKLPFWKYLAKFYTPLYPLAFESFDLSAYDIVISSTAHFAKGVLTRPDQLHVCYCHTPPRFLYGYPAESTTRRKGILKPFAALLDHILRQYDYWFAQRPDYFIANSEVVAKRIKKYYGREGVVVNPPVSVKEKTQPTQVTENNSHHPPAGKNNYFLVVSRLVKYKNVDTVIKAFNQYFSQSHKPSTSNHNPKLLIAGTGNQENYLKKIAGDNIEFLGFVSDEERNNLYKNAKALISAVSDEDFGIVPIEAMAAGCPVVALESGGIANTVVDSVTGVFYKNNTPESLVEALNRFEDLNEKMNPETIKKYAEKYNEKRFIEEITRLIAEWKAV